MAALSFLCSIGETLAAALGVGVGEAFASALGEMDCLTAGELPGLGGGGFFAEFLSDLSEGGTATLWELAVACLIATSDSWLL